MKNKILLIGIIIVLIILSAISFILIGLKNQKTIKVGDSKYTLEVGIYQSDLEENVKWSGTYEIRKDGTFTYTNTWLNRSAEEEVADGIGNYEIYFSEGDIYDSTQAWIIQFNFTSGKNSGTYQAFDIIGDNQFSARQYPNHFTLIEE